MADIIELTNAFIHVMFAVYLVGSGLFYNFLIVPELKKNLSPPDQGKFRFALGSKMKIINMIVVLVLIVTGLYRLFIEVGITFDNLFTSAYGQTALVKILLVIVTIGVSIFMGTVAEKVPTASPEERPALIKKVDLLSKALTTLGILIILFAELLRFYSVT